MLFGERHGATQGHRGRGDGLFGAFSSRTLREQFTGRLCSAPGAKSTEADAAVWAGIIDGLCSAFDSEYVSMSAAFSAGIDPLISSFLVRGSSFLGVVWEGGFQLDWTCSG